MLCNATLPYRPLNLLLQAEGPLAFGNLLLQAALHLLSLGPPVVPVLLQVLVHLGVGHTLLAASLHLKRLHLPAGQQWAPRAGVGA